jgi:lactococcin 972 family bacteriocin
MKLRQGLLTVIAAAIILIVTAVPSYAIVTYTGGGKWDHGVGVRIVWSYYAHAKYCHKASAYGAYWAYSGNTRAGVWAKASAERSFDHTNESYWNNRCPM